MNKENHEHLNGTEAHKLVQKVHYYVDELIHKMINESKASEIQKWVLKGRVINFLVSRHYGLLFTQVKKDSAAWNKIVRTNRKRLKEKKNA